MKRVFLRTKSALNIDRTYQNSYQKVSKYRQLGRAIQRFWDSPFQPRFVVAVLKLYPFRNTHSYQLLKFELIIRYLTAIIRSNKCNFFNP